LDGEVDAGASLTCPRDSAVTELPTRTDDLSPQLSPQLGLHDRPRRKRGKGCIPARPVSDIRTPSGASKQFEMWMEEINSEFPLMVRRMGCSRCGKTYVGGTMLEMTMATAMQNAARQVHT
jgi:hypothetical protein